MNGYHGSSSAAAVLFFGIAAASFADMNVREENRKTAIEKVIVHP